MKNYLFKLGGKAKKASIEIVKSKKKNWFSNMRFTPALENTDSGNGSQNDSEKKKNKF